MFHQLLGSLKRGSRLNSSFGMSLKSLNEDYTTEKFPTILACGHTISSQLLSDLTRNPRTTRRSLYHLNLQSVSTEKNH